MYRQFGTDPDQTSDKQTVKNFRRKVLRELKKIKLAWPDLNYSTAATAWYRPAPSGPAAGARSRRRRLAGISLPLAERCTPPTPLWANRLEMGQSIKIPPTVDTMNDARRMESFYTGFPFSLRAVKSIHPSASDRARFFSERPIGS